MAGIGAGGNRCRQNLKHFVDRKQNVVALADPWDYAEWQGPAKQFREKYYPQAKIYRDYRELFDKEQGLDGVVVVTPDHWHAKISADALRRGIPTYTEKPLTRTISEARILKQIARETGLVTQMGNNGHAGDTPAVPSSLDWDLWLGPAQHRLYHQEYTRKKWRGWVDFGAGALGDMGCHILDPVFWAMKLGHPTRVEATTTIHPQEARDETFPTAAIITYRYPVREDMPPLRVHFYTGGLRAPRSEVIPASYSLPTNGAIFVGSKGVMLSEFGQQPVLFPESLALENPTPQQVIPRGPDHWTEWMDAVKHGDRSCGSNFDYAADLTEMVLLGIIAARVAESLEWDGEAM